MRRLLIGLVMLASAPSYAQDRGGEDDDEATTGKQGTYGRFHALLIGVSKYEDETLTLRGPKNDVEMIGRILVDSCGFLETNVKTLTDEEATKDKIRAHIQAYQGVLKSQDHLLIWYAGHGEKGAVKEQDGFWLPYGARRGRRANETTWLRFDTVLKWIDDIKTGGNILLVSDSCFSGGLTEGSKTGRKNFLVLTSGQLDRVEDVYMDGKSNFAIRFYEALQRLEVQARNYNGYTLTIGDVYEDPRFQGLPHGPLLRTRQGGIPDESTQFVFVHAASFFDPKEAAAKMNRQVKSEFDSRQIDGITVYTPRPSKKPKDPCEMVLIPVSEVSVDGKVHKVAPFLIDRTEVTVRMFKKFLRERGKRLEIRYWNELGYNNPDQPAVGMRLEHARDYARWAGKDIPKEAEWEAAAAGVDPVLKEPAWKPWPPLISPRRPVLPGSKAKKDLSRFGVFDLRGGVREWCENMRGLQGKAVLKGSSVVATKRSERWKFHWAREWAEVTDADVPRNNVGFRCVVRWRRK